MRGEWLPGDVNYFLKTAAPGVTDDQNSGYAVSDLWIDETGDAAYILLDATAGAAVWLEIHPDITADAVSIAELGTATYDAVQDWLNNTQASGYVSGGGFTDNGGGSLTVAAGTGFIKTTNSAIGATKSFDWAESTFTVTDGVTTYVGVNYAGGSPVVFSEESKTADGRTKFYLGKVFREGATIHMLEAGQDLTELAKRVQARITAIEGEFQRASGMVTSETGERYLVITAGVGFAGLTRIATTEIDTTGADTFDYYYYDGAVWQESYVSQIDNAYYNNVTSGLVALTPNRYGVHWVYLGHDSHPMAVYGQGDYTLAQAENATPPSSLPEHVENFSGLIAKIIVREGATNLYSVETAFETAFNTAGIADHGDLAGLSDDDHPQYIKDSEFTAADEVMVGTGAGTFGQVTLGASQFLAKKAAGAVTNVTAAEARAILNVEDAADVTDATNVASVLHAAAGKTTPVDADELGLIDSAASNVLKKLTWANLKATIKTYTDTLYSVAGAVFGSTGSTDNAVIVADGTGGKTTQATNLTVSEDGDDLTVPGSVSAATMTPTGLTTGYVPYKSAGALADAPIYTNGTKTSVGGTDLTDNHKFIVDASGVLGMQIKSDVDTSAAYLFLSGDSKSAVLRMTGSATAYPNMFEIQNDGTTVFAGDGSGNAGIATTALGSGGAKTLVIPNGTVQTTPPVNASVFYAQDVSTSSEMFVADEAGNDTQLSAHAQDAPEWMYDWDLDQQPPNIKVELNRYVGTVRYTNQSRMARLQQMQFFGEALPADPLKKTVVHNETFAEHNTRNGYEPGHPSYLVALDWDTVQQYHVDTAAGKIALATATKSVLVELATDAADVVPLTESATMEITSTIERFVFEISEIVTPEPYTAKPKPAWLQRP